MLRLRNQIRSFMAAGVAAALLAAGAGCAVHEADYQDPQQLGVISPHAELRNKGLVGHGLVKVKIDSGQVSEQGTVIVVAGEQPIFYRVVGPGDEVEANLSRWADGCIVQLSVNGNVVTEQVAKPSLYRIYFVPADAGT
jgi:hypothetical protein